MAENRSPGAPRTRPAHRSPAAVHPTAPAPSAAQRSYLDGYRAGVEDLVDHLLTGATHAAAPGDHPPLRPAGSGAETPGRLQGAVVVVKDEWLSRIDEVARRLEAAGLVNPAVFRALGAVRGLAPSEQIDALRAVEGVKSVDYPILLGGEGG